MSNTTCGSGGCGCAGSTDNLPQEDAAPVARINGVPLHADGEILPPDVLRQRACTELLRQQAQREGLLSQDDAPGLDGATSAEASQAIERLLDQALQVPEPSEEVVR